MPAAVSHDGHAVGALVFKALINGVDADLLQDLPGSDAEGEGLLLITMTSGGEMGIEPAVHAVRAVLGSLLKRLLVRV